MSINNLREYTSAYPKTLGPLWRYYRDKPALKNNSNITDFPANHNNSISLSNLNSILQDKQETVAQKC